MTVALLGRRTSRGIALRGAAFTRKLLHALIAIGPLSVKAR